MLGVVPLAIKTMLGGLAVVGFSLFGQAGHPKRFAGLFAAAPSIALASLGMNVALRGTGGTLPYLKGMVFGSAGLVDLDAHRA
jgi:hypothetical protein